MGRWTTGNAFPLGVRPSVRYEGRTLGHWRVDTKGCYQFVVPPSDYAMWHWTAPGNGMHPDNARQVLLAHVANMPFVASHSRATMHDSLVLVTNITDQMAAEAITQAIVARLNEEDTYALR